MQALCAACADGRIAADPVLVLSDVADAPALDRAGRVGVPTVAVPRREFPGRAAFDAALGEALDAVRPDIVALAGFMRVLGPELVARFAGRMLNIHPSLLPKYPGLHTHRRALAAGDRLHGATVHFVTAALDGGPRVVCGTVCVARADDEASLAMRVLEQVELKIYPQAVAWMARGDLRLEDGRVKFAGRELVEPLTLEDVEVAFR